MGSWGVRVFESLREPFALAIHSELGVNEAAFELHAQLLRFDFWEPRGRC